MISIFVAILLVGLLFWAAEVMIPPQYIRARRVLEIIVILFLILWLLQFLNVTDFGAFPNRRR